MTTLIRQTVVAVAFAATVALGITGATLRGETKETDVAATCEAAAWPNIPAECLAGAGNDIRYISANEPAAVTIGPMASNGALADRFQTAFE